MNANLDDIVNAMASAYAVDATYACGANSGSQNYLDWAGSQNNRRRQQNLALAALRSLAQDPQYLAGNHRKRHLADEFLREASKRHPEWTVKRIVP